MGEISMNSPLVGLRVAAIVFGVVALLQLMRLVTQFEVTVDGHFVPFWANAIALVVAAGLSAWMWRLSALARIGGTR
jgi:hypothetical protein